MKYQSWIFLCRVNSSVFFMCLIKDVTMKVISFSQQGPRAICILSANGVISSVTLRQPDSSGGTLTYEVTNLSACPLFISYLWVSFMWHQKNVVLVKFDIFLIPFSQGTFWDTFISGFIYSVWEWWNKKQIRWDECFFIKPRWTGRWWQRGGSTGGRQPRAGMSRTPVYFNL